jgi:F-type H+-transporting ATPase subunit b
MHFDWSTFALQIVNFAILVWLLHRFLYRPVLRLIDARRDEIEKQYAAARDTEAAAEAGRAGIEAEHAGIAAERSAMLRQAADEADAAAAARRTQAEREATALIENARKTIAAEREEALAEARRAALDLGTEIAGRLVAEMPMRLRAEAWLGRIDEHLAALSSAERQALGEQLVNGERLTVVTVSEMPAETREAWHNRLRRTLGNRIAIEFAVDPSLVAGTELHFPTTVLRFSWKSALAAMREEIAADAHAR